MTPGDTRIGREAVGGKDVLPAPFFVRVRVFARQGKGQIDGPVAFFQVTLMKLFDARQVGLERLAQLVREYSNPVFHSFPFAHDNLALIEIQVFDAQADTFHQAQAAAVEEFGHQLRVAGHLPQHGLYFGLAEDDGEMFGLLGADNVQRLVKVQV